MLKFYASDCDFDHAGRHMSASTARTYLENIRALETVQTVIWKPCCTRLIYPGGDAW